MGETVLDRPTNTAGEPVSPEALLARLLDFEPVQAPVISLYLDARADQHGRENFLPFVRKQLSERERTYTAGAAERDSFEEDFVLIVQSPEIQSPTSKDLESNTRLVPIRPIFRKQEIPVSLAISALRRQSV